jgi:nitroimidazol reductase NimA-like FMN-containing flavoprotein (pyridoxamine 5'-phosphate oxidase superfamily)
MQQYHLNNRPDREITSPEELQDILRKGKYVTIALCRDNEPYIVTLSYGYDAERNTLYFHASGKGLKLDFLRANSLVCATVVEDHGYVMDDCSHNYRTVVFWGEMTILEDLNEKKHGMAVLLEHLEEKPTVVQKFRLEADGLYHRISMLKLEIKQLHGKARKPD